MVRAETVVLKEGSLATALRATMSIPGIFTPVEREGRLLADGGLLDNVPADVARGLGVDVVIAVDVGESPADPSALPTLSGAPYPSIAVTTAADTRPAPEVAGPGLVPDL